MNQYSEKAVPMLLRDRNKISHTEFKLQNGMAEFTVNGESVVLPTVEAFQRLLKRVAVLEQRLATVDNRSHRAVRSNRG
jgi:hypothetical protein